MKELSADFQSHLDGEVTTLCNCWRIIREDGIELGFTDHDHELSFDGITFEPSSGFESSQMEETSGLAPNNHDVIGALMSDAITEDDIVKRRYDGARIRHYVVNWSSPDEHTLMQTYLFGDIAREDGRFRAELKSLVATLDRTNLRRFEKRCNADLGDAKCGVDLEDGFAKYAVITKIVSADTFEVSGVDGFQSGWFTAGKATFTSGENAGQRLEITRHANHEKGSARVVVSFWEKPALKVDVGDTVNLVPGCDKLFSTCGQKFDNALNFRGFPHMPGTEFAMSYASNSGKMNGRPLVK